MKERETESFEQILLVLDDVKPIDCIEWDFTPSFVGFRHFLYENSISDYSLTIDRERLLFRPQPEVLSRNHILFIKTPKNP